MDIYSITHKGLRDYYLSGKAKGLRQDLVPRIRTVLIALEAASNIDDLDGPPGWRIHELKGDRAGVWSISVSGNWRITFRIETSGIEDLNLEDYH